MTPSMVESMINALEELGVPARSGDLRLIKGTLERLYAENDRLHAAIRRCLEGSRPTAFATWDGFGELAEATGATPSKRVDHHAIGAGGGDDEGYIHPDVLAMQTPEVRAQHATPSVGAARSPRELYCENCACEYPVWCAPNELWNAVVREPSDAAGVEEPFLCLTCFAVRAEEHGVRPTAWIVRPECAEDMPVPRASQARPDLQAAAEGVMAAQYKSPIEMAHALANLGAVLERPQRSPCIIAECTHNHAGEYALCPVHLHTLVEMATRSGTER